METNFSTRWRKMIAVMLSLFLLSFVITSCNKDKGDSEITEELTFSGTYTFTSTNFDDGWKSTVKEDWVEVLKGNMKVLIHYPKEGTIIAADPEPVIINAWNILVAPRYNNIKNFKVAPTLYDYIRPYFASANLTDADGNEVYVAFFRKGDTGWIEFVAPDKNTFFGYFGIDIDQINWDTDSRIYDKLVGMSGYNKFAVAAADLPGKWSNNFASNTFYVNIYTGYDAGMSTYASTETYVFNAKSYNWEIIATNSSGGHSTFNQAKSSGTFNVVNNWQIYCSDIEGKPVTYDAFFSCIKGARFLWLKDSNLTTAYTPYGRIK